MKKKENKEQGQNVPEKDKQNKKEDKWKAELNSEKLKKRERTDSYRKAIRRIYKVRIKKGRGRRNDDLVSKTPHEQRNKKISEGYEVSRDFVEMYEKARYGRDNVTKDDVRNMHNL